MLYVADRIPPDVDDLHMLNLLDATYKSRMIPFEFYYDLSHSKLFYSYYPMNFPFPFDPDKTLHSVTIEPDRYDYFGKLDPFKKLGWNFMHIQIPTSSGQSKSELAFACFTSLRTALNTYSIPRKTPFIGYFGSKLAPDLFTNVISLTDKYIVINPFSANKIMLDSWHIKNIILLGGDNTERQLGAYNLISNIDNYLISEKLKKNNFSGRTPVSSNSLFKFCTAFDDKLSLSHNFCHKLELFPPNIFRKHHKSIWRILLGMSKCLHSMIFNDHLKYDPLIFAKDTGLAITSLEDTLNFPDDLKNPYVITDIIYRKFKIIFTISKASNKFVLVDVDLSNKFVI
jgi:hypothetical protein